MKQDDPKPIVSYPETAVLTARQVCEALQISIATLNRLAIPTVYLGNRSRRYVWRQVLKALEGRAQ